MDTTKQVALITGGGSGIGLAIAQELLARGSTVVVTGRDNARLERAARGLSGAHAIRCDVTDDVQVRHLFEQVGNDIGELTLLVNNAGVAHVYDLGDYAQAGSQMYEEVMTNFLAPLRLTSMALPILLRQPSAAVVNISSVLAYAGTPDSAVYGATKAGLHSFSRSLRARLEGTSVRVFEVLPAVVDTALLGQLDVPKARPEVVARALMAALAKNRYEVRVGEARAAYLLSRLSVASAEKAVQRAMTSRTKRAVGDS